MKNSFIHPADELMLTMERIYQYKMTTTSGGNLSIRDTNGDVWITPAGVDKGRLTREDMVCVHPDGTVEGRHRPSSELPFHQAIYRMRPDIGGIVHAHPVALVAFSICRQVPDTRLFHQARHVCGEVAFAPYALPGSEKLGARIADSFAGMRHCVVLENHGVVVGGGNLQEAFQRFETLEFTAKTIIKGRMLGTVHYLTNEEVDLPRAGFTYLPEQGEGTRVVTTREKALRRDLCAFVQRSYRQRLMISTEGSFSVRLDERSFLITPYQVDRQSVAPEQIVLVRDGEREPGKFASRAARNHRAIYDAMPEVGAIINAYTVNASAFSVTRQRLNVRTIPESYVFLRDVGYVPYGEQFQGGPPLLPHLSREQPAVLLENDGVLVTGPSILGAFDRLEVLEATAEALINSLPLGPVSSMGDTVIAELRAAFRM
jgi:L-fuculose-phosphate aldolase